MVKKNYDNNYVISRFHLIPERYRRTDRQDKHNSYINIPRMLTRDKNDVNLILSLALAVDAARYEKFANTCSPNLLHYSPQQE